MLPQGDFTATLAGVNLGYFFTPRIYVQSLIQHSDQIDTWSANIRFGWLNTAGTGLFIVYNEVQGIETLTGPLGRSVYLKFTRQLNVFGGVGRATWSARRRASERVGSADGTLIAAATLSRASRVFILHHRHFASFSPRA